MLNFAAICPHPPIIIPTIGKQNLIKVSETIEAMERLSEKFREKDPETVVIISPHAPIAANSFIINTANTVVGHFANFGDFDTELTFKNDLDLIKEIEKKFQVLSKLKNIPVQTRAMKELDHGTLVPAYYLAKGKPDFNLVSMSYSRLDLKTHFKLGKILQQTIQQQDRKIGIIASGDLSHRLTKDAPAGYSPQAEKFDKKLIKLLKKKDVDAILNLDPNLVQQAGQCGYRSIIILLGALSNLEYEAEILSYQGPFGVGYLVAWLKLKS